jgi:hypothetical protein
VFCQDFDEPLRIEWRRLSHHGQPPGNC